MGYVNPVQKNGKENTMPLTMTKDEAIKWLLRNLEHEIRYDGCHAYQNDPESCEMCKKNLDTLEQIKKVLGVK